MTMRIVRLGDPKVKGEGLRIGTVRRPPRGVRKQDYAKKNIYDVWFPNLAPSETLLKEASPLDDPGHWKVFKRRFMSEMKSPVARKDLELLAALSHETNFSIGCYCENPSLCHRSLLKQLLEKLGAKLRESRL